MKMKYIIIVLVIIVLLSGCSNDEVNKDDSTSTEYENVTIEPTVDVNIETHLLEEFDSIVVGESTRMDVYRIVGDSAYYWNTNTRTVDVYYLDDGRYMCITCIHYQVETGLDFTIDEIEICDEKPKP